MPAATTPPRRSVEYQTLEEFRNDAEQLAAGPYVTVGNWSFAQILEHLNIIMKFSLDGFPFQYPAILRATVGPIIKWQLLRKPMPSGFKLPKSAQALVPSDNADLSNQLEELRTTLDRFEKESATKPHPVFGKMSKDDWSQLHRRHAAMHMSFVVPNESANE